MNAWDVLNAISLLKRLHDRYESNPTDVACDLLMTISRAATHHGVPLQSMLDAVKKGARL